MKRRGRELGVHPPGNGDRDTGKGGALLISQVSAQLSFPSKESPLTPRAVLGTPFRAPAAPDASLIRLFPCVVTAC